MQPAGMPIQAILQILGNSAWGGVGVIISSALSAISIFLALKSRPRQFQSLPPLKKFA